MKDPCKKCGQCCRIKRYHEDKMHLTDDYCGFLDLETMKCMVYDRRHEMREAVLHQPCLSIVDAIAVGVVPADCGYVDETYETIVEEWK